MPLILPVHQIEQPRQTQHVADRETEHGGFLTFVQKASNHFLCRLLHSFLMWKIGRKVKQAAAMRTGSIPKQYRRLYRHGFATDWAAVRLTIRSSGRDHGNMRRRKRMGGWNAKSYVRGQPI